jgi:hypothetical protein
MKIKPSIRVCVTQKDIDSAFQSRRDGKRRSESCPIATSLRRRKGFEDFTVGISSFGNNRIRYILPDAGRDFIRLFDNQFTAKPITFVAKHTLQRAA